MLIAGAELLVRGASRIAAAVGISSLVIGLTVVAFGTSAPELVISILSAAEGKPDIALGNVIGSNIFNVLFILGISAIIGPLVVARQLIRLDVPVMIVVSLLLLLFGWNGHLAFWEGVVLILGGIGYNVWVIRESRRQQAQETPANIADNPEPRRTPLQVLFILMGLALLIFGSRFMVDSAVSMATRFGISDLIIGLTIIAAGTSLPELATSILASIRGERDIAVGNVVGSNIFNILFILGITIVVSGRGIAVPPTAMYFDLPVMIAVAVACLPIFFTGHQLDRWEGFIFFGYYVAYTAFLILSNQNSAYLSDFTAAMTWFVFPLTVLTLVVLFLRERRQLNG